MIIIFTSYHSPQIPFQGTCTSTCIWNIYGIAYTCILPPLPWSWTRLVNTCKHHHKPFNFVTSNCTPETCGQCEVYVFLSRSLDFMHLWADGYFKHWSVAYIGDAGIMKVLWWTVPSYEQCSALNTAITTHLFVFETTRRSLNFPTGLNGGITEASAIQLTNIIWSRAAQK